MNEPEGDIDQQLATLEAKTTELVNRCCYASGQRTATEIRRTARAENRLMPYLQATFTQMNHASSVLRPEIGQKASIELIGLLESNEQARSIQPDFPENEYARAVHWYSSCAYDNLAKATALLKGYNSDGMHACIADGIQVCRRTGKMQCVTCFREYATEVHRAADDLEMAIHFARANITQEKQGPHDRRWAGAKDLARIWLLKGEMNAAIESVELAWSLLDTWHNPLSARLDTRLLMREIALLLGEPTRWDDRIDAQSPAAANPPAGEYLWHEWRCDAVEAAAHCQAGQPELAVNLLTAWDRKLSENQCLHDWMDNQLRLLVAYRMAGDQVAFARVAERLEVKAKTARDWITLRCLERLRDKTAAVALIPIVGALKTSQPAAGSAGDASSTDSPATDDSDSRSRNAQERKRPDPPEFILRILERFRAIHLSAQEGAGDNADTLASVLADLMATNAESPLTVADVQWMLHTATFLVSDGCPRQELWDWAERISQPHLQDAVVLNLLATLAFTLHANMNADEKEVVDLPRIERMFRDSLELDPNRFRNFARAADFFLYQENIGEAERCLARGLRLDRSDGELAMKLAKVYRYTERDRDALAILDMCLREGCDNADVLWEAGLTAYQVDSHEAAVNYLDAYDKRQPGRPWVHYYRAASLLELRRFAEALAAADEEAIRSPDCPFPIAIFRAAANAGLEQPQLAFSHLEQVLALPLAEIENLTPQGMRTLFGLLWNIMAPLLSSNADLRERIVDRMIASGMAPSGLFTEDRETRDIANDLNFYVCSLHQPLDDRWADWHGKLSSENDLKSYAVTWGVLAESEDEAAKIALAWQKRAYPLTATVMEVQLQDGGYRDKPGVVWQGYRYEGE